MAINERSYFLFRTAAGRKVGPYRATIVPIEDLPPEQKWKIPESDKSDDDDASSSDEDLSDEDVDMEVVKEDKIDTNYISL